ncbi:hypothetical protein CspeluHIS016_0205900 [Cutaneotrichosporon spelunceum]|uniref:Chromo domain-containing protein n=1 Tax=Cutaneotrichosporon spelunceum TaxID=1672016 RepID=A0AAD3TRY6_9TREE|nr:hypothetical protein CspeluHIS016_0205900 [Cutaneotrichosporon spelunceum]
MSDAQLRGSDKEPVYVIDAICWAEYKDSTFERPDGGVGWHYYVMWQGYLKAGSDTIELRDSFLDDPDDVNERSPALLEFWKSVRGKRVREDKDEPGGKIGEIRFASDDLLRRKFKESNPRRSFAAYKRRIKELKKARKDGFDRAQVRKGDSDYYIRRKRKAQRESEKETAKKATTQVIPKRDRAPEPVHYHSQLSAIPPHLHSPYGHNRNRPHRLPSPCSLTTRRGG